MRDLYIWNVILEIFVDSCAILVALLLVVLVRRLLPALFAFCFVFEKSAPFVDGWGVSAAWLSAVLGRSLLSTTYHKSAFQIWNCPFKGVVIFCARLWSHAVQSGAELLLLLCILTKYFGDELTVLKLFNFQLLSTFRVFERFRIEFDHMSVIDASLLMQIGMAILVPAAVPHELLLIKRIRWVQILRILLNHQAWHHWVALRLRDLELWLLRRPQNCCHLLEVDVFVGCVGLTDWFIIVVQECMRLCHIKHSINAAHSLLCTCFRMRLLLHCLCFILFTFWIKFWIHFKFTKLNTFSYWL